MSRREDFDGVSGSYTAAATLVGGLLLPAGDAWREAWRRDPDLPLYGRDGFHPSPLGSYLAALVVFHEMTGRLPPSASVPGISPRQLEILRAAADRSGRPHRRDEIRARAAYVRSRDMLSHHRAGARCAHGRNGAV